MPKSSINRSSSQSFENEDRALNIELSRSKNMAKIRGRDTSPEMRLRKSLWRLGFRFRVNIPVIGIRPDIVFTARKLAIFVDGCFWHGCPIHYVRPRTRDEFWAEKLRANTARDRRQTEALIESGWKVMRFWEHEVRLDLSQVMEEINAAYHDKSTKLKDRLMVVKVEPAGADGTIERWYIECLAAGQPTYEELRQRPPPKKPPI